MKISIEPRPARKPFFLAHVSSSSSLASSSLPWVADAAHRLRLCLSPACRLLHSPCLTAPHPSHLVSYPFFLTRHGPSLPHGADGKAGGEAVGARDQAGAGRCAPLPHLLLVPVGCCCCWCHSCPIRSACRFLPLREVARFLDGPGRTREGEDDELRSAAFNSPCVFVVA